MSTKNLSLKFILLQKNNFKAFEKIKRFYKNSIEPIYGNQDKALNKIFLGLDRKCELLYYNDLYVGAIVYKNNLNNKYCENNIKNAFELKSMFLFENTKFSGLFFTLLLKKVSIRACEYSAENIICTVSSKKLNIKKLLEKFGFVCFNKINDLYIENIQEFFLRHNNPKEIKVLADGYLDKIKNKRQYNIEISL